ncbi:Amidohydrolase 3 [Coniochaeta hoffmannii]|uniref:Amidohydrolase 3 n=1 Tax=Coniochaeta hoffmannii TaxID=91930 RepID=A0AA38RNN9_9PEZI|nr:Amidohydrolase 3 [Coniochaeta hoffmannii]
MTTTAFINGRIFLSGVKPGTNPSPTSPPTFASALVIKDSLITAVGSPSSDPTIAAALALPDTTVVDLAGKTILPGFVDGHMHLMLLGQSLQKLDLGACKTLADIQSTIRAYAAANPALPRILCRGWMHSMTPGGVSAADLDGLDVEGMDRPVLVDTKDLHSAWCNTAGIAALGAEKWADVPGGIIARDEAGRPTGVFSEAANITYVWPWLASVAGMEERMDAVRAAVAAYHAAGYTGMVDMAMDEGAWEAVLALREQMGGDFGMRLSAYWLVKPSASEAENLAQVDRAAELAGLYNSATTPDCRVVGIKVIGDGIIDACTAGLSEPYSHDGTGTNPIWTREELEPVVRRAEEKGLQIALHAIGDATIKMAVDVLAECASPARRPRIEHIELASKEDADRLGKFGITASIQPVHADPAILRAWPRLIGKHRCKRAFAYREFADGGAPLALGSDAPTAPHSPLGNVYVGTTRRSYREPEMTTTVNENFALGLCEAVAAATEGAAYSCFEDGRLGRLAVGLKADFVVVDMHWEKEKLMEARMKETWFDGKRVWASDE